MQIPAQFGTGRTFRLVSALTWGLGVVHAAEAQGAAAAAAKPGPVFVNGTAQIVPAFQDSTRWIRQHLWVEELSGFLLSHASLPCRAIQPAAAQ